MSINALMPISGRNKKLAAIARVPANDSERSDEFRRKLLHALFATQCSSQKESTLAAI
jgi:hypothetical protein